MLYFYYIKKIKTIIKFLLIFMKNDEWLLKKLYSIIINYILFFKNGCVRVYLKKKKGEGNYMNAMFLRSWTGQKEVTLQYPECRASYFPTGRALFWISARRSGQFKTPQQDWTLTLALTYSRHFLINGSWVFGKWAVTEVC